MAQPIEIIEGARFNRWTIIKEAPVHIQPNGKPCRMVHCKCDCGNETIITWSTVRLGYSKSCGCYMKEVNGERIRKQSITHGNTPISYNEFKSLYFVWSNIRQRCYNEKAAKYSTYGKKGIRVCNEWLTDFVAFRDWSLENGYYKQPKDTLFKDKLSIDRIDSTKDYCPENCRWITMSENSSRRHLKNQKQTFLT